MPRTNHVWGILLAAGAAIIFSPAAIFVKMAGSVSMWEISCLRLLFASLTTALMAFLTNTPLKPKTSELKPLAACAAITALHFTCFTAALERTSVAHTLSLTYTAPVFSAFLAQFFLDEELSWKQYIGIFAVVFSVSMLCFSKNNMYQFSHSGNAIALLSGFALGSYHLIGRAFGRKLPLFRYAFWLYFGAGLYLLPFAWPFASNYERSSLLAIFLQGGLCTAVGHTLTNAALRFTHTAHVSMIVTQEVTGGVFLAAIVLGEKPNPSAYLALLALFFGLAAILEFKRTDQ